MRTIGGLVVAVALAFGSAGCKGREDCSNDKDDDGDGLVDCADPLCFDDPVCGGEDCGNMADDDGDALVDCNDVDCVGADECLGVENCVNLEDDDDDGDIDCDDEDCADDTVCQPEDCDNGTDDNADGLSDCDDPECAADPACLSEDCENGTDDDGDTFADCEDTDCQSESVCTTTVFTDPVDVTGAGSDPAIDITEITAEWLEGCDLQLDVKVNSTYPPSSSYYSYFHQSDVYLSAGGSPSWVGSATIQRHDGVNSTIIDPPGNDVTITSQPTGPRFVWGSAPYISYVDFTTGLLITSSSPFRSDTCPDGAGPPLEIKECPYASP